MNDSFRAGSRFLVFICLRIRNADQPNGRARRRRRWVGSPDRLLPRGLSNCHGNIIGLLFRGCFSDRRKPDVPPFDLIGGFSGSAREFPRVSRANEPRRADRDAGPARFPGRRLSTVPAVHDSKWRASAGCPEEKTRGAATRRSRRPSGSLCDGRDPPRHHANLTSATSRCPREACGHQERRVVGFRRSFSLAIPVNLFND